MLIMRNLNLINVQSWTYLNRQVMYAQRSLSSTPEAHVTCNSIVACCRSGKWVLRNILSQIICVFRRDYLNSESQDKKKVPFDLTGWKTASPKVLCHIVFAFVFVCPSDCFITFLVELLISFYFFTSYRIYRSNWTDAIAEFSLARYDLPQMEKASLTFSFSQPCYFGESFLGDMYTASQIETEDAVWRFCARDFPTG